MKQVLLTTAAVVLATNASSQHAHGTNSISETGQSQFAAIAEIVTLLRADAGTDWTTVDIDALRNHLVDMDNVTAKSVVKTRTDDLMVTFAVTGEPPVALSVRRMVKAHAPMLQGAAGWSVKARDITHGAEMVMEATTRDELNQIMGLGFFGVMTIGAHHQQHHAMIAIGRSPH